MGVKEEQREVWIASGFPHMLSPTLLRPPQRDEDAENLGNFVMFPANGSIDLMYFPYYGKKFHVSPVGGWVLVPAGERGPGEEAELLRAWSLALLLWPR